MIYLYIIIIIIVFFLILGYYFFNFSQNPKLSRKRLFKNKAPATLTSKESINWFNKSNYKEVYVNSFDNKKLHGYLINNKLNNYVIFVHGYTNNALEVLDPANNFYKHGYSILLIDQRAHGKSEGKYSGMCSLEKGDILNWCRYIRKINNKSKIILYGISMGATSVMMSTGEHLPNNVKCAIEDCGYISLYDQFYNQLKHLKFLPKPIIFSANIFSMLINHISIYKENAIKQIKKSKIPMLFIHGDKDRLVGIDNLETAYNEYPNTKEKLIIKDAKHMKSQIINPNLYWNTIYSFIKKYIK